MTVIACDELASACNELKKGRIGSQRQTFLVSYSSLISMKCEVCRDAFSFNLMLYIKSEVMY